MAYLAIEELQPVRGFLAAQIPAAEDIWDGDPASDVLSLANHQGLRMTIDKYAGATGTATITVESCDNVTPSNTVAIPFRYRVTTGATPGAWQAAAAAGFATTAGADQSYDIAVLASGLDGTDKFVRVQVTELVDSPCDGGYHFDLFNGRFVFDGGIDPTS